MSNSTTRGTRLGGRNASHLVDIIELATRARAVRRSKIAFWAVGATVGLTTGVVTSALTAWYKAALIGFLTGIIVGFLVGLALFVWPAVRVLWHWLAEIVLLGLVLTGYLLAASVLPWWLLIPVFVSVLSGPLLLPGLRRRIWPWVMCAVARHRLRVCFAAFVASQRTGMTPLILFARPIPAGERVWIWLRPGLASADLEVRLDRLAAGCRASECRISPASRRYSALLRIDLARRNPLAASVGSPLPDLLPANLITSTAAAGAPAGGLDLPDVPDAITPVTTSPRRRLAAFPVNPDPVLDDLLAPHGAKDDLSDWI